MSLFSYDEEYEVVVIGKQNIYNILSVIVIFRFNVNVRLLKGDKNILDAAPAISNTKQTIISLFHMQICIVYFNQNI